MTRIIGGRAGSLRLQVPQRGTRPTSDRVREAIFSRLTAWQMLENAAVLDLYAGSGALGLEALSRGSNSAVLVEKHPKAAQIVHANAQAVCKALGLEQTVATVHTAAVNTWLGQQNSGAFDIVFIDPPYDLPEPELAQTLSLVSKLLTPDAVVLVERDKRSPQPLTDLELLQQKTYGETSCWWFGA